MKLQTLGLSWRVNGEHNANDEEPESLAHDQSSPCAKRAEVVQLRARIDELSASVSQLEAKLTQLSREADQRVDSVKTEVREAVLAELDDRPAQVAGASPIDPVDRDVLSEEFSHLFPRSEAR